MVDQVQETNPDQINSVEETVRIQNKVWPVLALLSALVVTYLANLNSSKVAAACQFRGVCSPTIIIHFLISTALVVYGVTSLSLQKTPIASRWKAIGFYGSITSIIAIVFYVYLWFWPDVPSSSISKQHFLPFLITITIIGALLNFLTLILPGQILKKHASTYLVLLGLLWGLILLLSLAPDL